MQIKNQKIDNGKPFDFGRTSSDYAKYRDIYPREFYEKIVSLGLCVNEQNVLDVGTGTGVLPRNMQKYGAKWTGTDISQEQIDQAKNLSVGMNIDYFSQPTETLDFSDGTFDVITACQCFWYFDHEKAAQNLCRMLKSGGSLLFLYMGWLPYEDKIAAKSEELVLKYNPNWSGKKDTIHPIKIPDCYLKYFEPIFHEEFPLKVHFTRETWNGRMKSCRGIGASLTEAEIAAWETEHKKLLSEIVPEEFDVLHYGAIAELRAKK